MRDAVEQQHVQRLRESPFPGESIRRVQGGAGAVLPRRGAGVARPGDILLSAAAGAQSKRGDLVDHEDRHQHATDRDQDPHQQTGDAEQPVRQVELPAVTRIGGRSGRLGVAR